MNIKRCDIILPTCGQVKLIKDCIESLIASTKYPYRLIAIDNGSSAEASDYLRKISASGKLDMILLKPDENLGWIKSINRGLELSEDSEYVAFQNDDTVFTEGWLEEAVRVFESDPKIGIVNPEWEKSEGTGKTIDMDWCRGHCFVVRRDVVKKLGGFDPVYIPVYYDDRDYSLKAIEAGYRCVKAKGAFVEHVRNMTMKNTMEQDKIAALMERNGNIFYKRWGYPLRIIFVLRDLPGSGELLRKMCMDQNKVIVLARKGKVPYEHTNLKIMRFAGIIFNVAVLLYIMSNRSKKRQKKTDFIFTDDRRFYSILKFFKRFIPAEIGLKNNIDFAKIRNLKYGI